MQYNIVVECDWYLTENQSNFIRFFFQNGALKKRINLILDQVNNILNVILCVIYAASMLITFQIVFQDLINVKSTFESLIDCYNPYANDCYLSDDQHDFYKKQDCKQY